MQLPKHSVLTQEEEVELAKKVQAGDESAREEFVCRNIPLVYHIAQKDYKGLWNLDDLVQEGIVGLMRAVDKFDHERGVRFMTYASYWIHQSMRSALFDKSHTIRIPRSSRVKMNKIKKVSEEMVRELGREPEVEEIAERLEMKPFVVRRFIRNEVHMVSKDKIPDGYAGSVGFDLDKQEEYEMLYECVDELPEGMRECIILRFGLKGHKPHSLREIAEQRGLTHQRIHQIIQAGVAKLKSLCWKKNMG